MKKDQVIKEIPIQDVLEANILLRDDGNEDQAFIELVASIKKIGIIEPIVVTKEKEKYRVVVGMRRKMAGEIAGLLTLPCIVRELTKEKVAVIRWSENENRKGIDPVGRAKFMVEMMEKMKWTQTQVAKKLLKSDAYVSQHLGVLAGYESVLDLLDKKEIAFSVARELNRAKNEGIANRLGEYAKGNNAGEKQVRIWVANENSKREVDVSEEVGGGGEKDEGPEEILELCDFCREGKDLAEIRWVKICKECAKVVKEG